MPRARLAAAALTALALWPGAANADILHDQLDMDETGAGGTTADPQMADDFVVSVASAGQFWRINRVVVMGNPVDPSIFPTTFKVGFFTDSSFLPAINEFATYNTSVTVGAMNSNSNAPYSFAIDPPLDLQPGRYWVSVQSYAEQDKYFYWIDRIQQKNGQSAARGTGSCPNWGLKLACGAGAGRPDLTFRIEGTVVTPPPPDQQPPPDTTAPGVALGGKKKQSIGDGAIDVNIQATETGTATASATVAVAKRFLAARTLKFRRATKQVAPGVRSTLRLKLSRKSRSAVLRALKAGRKESAKVTVTVSDSAGNRSVTRKTVALKR